MPSLAEASQPFHLRNPLRGSLRSPHSSHYLRLSQWICSFCKEAEQKKANPPQKKPRVSKPRAANTVKNSFKTSKTKQQTLTGLVSGGVKIPKKTVTEVKLPDAKDFTDLDYVKRR